MFRGRVLPTIIHALFITSVVVGSRVARVSSFESIAVSRVAVGATITRGAAASGRVSDVTATISRARTATATAGLLIAATTRRVAAALIAEHGHIVVGSNAGVARVQGIADLNRRKVLLSSITAATGLLAVATAAGLVAAAAGLLAALIAEYRHVVVGSNAGVARVQSIADLNRHTILLSSIATATGLLAVATATGLVAATLIAEYRHVVA